MSQYRKKPVVIEAMQYDGDNGEEIIDWAKAVSDPHDCMIHYLKGHNASWFKIKTLEGEMEVSPNDWVICGVQGEFYPCKPDIFEKTYEKV